MTLRQPYLTPNKNIRISVPEGSVATDIKRFTNPIPFSQTEWPRVRTIKPSVDATDPSEMWLFNVVVAAPFIPVDYGRQRMRVYLPPDQPRNLNIASVGSPVIPFDWGRQQNIPDFLPPPQYPNIALNTAVVFFPFYTQDFSRPFVPVPAKPDQQALNINLYTNPIPFAQYDWSKPVSIRLQQPDQSNLPDKVLYNFSTPFAKLDWGVVGDIRALPDVVYPNLLLIQPVLVPFTPVDYSTTRKLPSVPSPALGSNQNLFTNPIPFNQYDWTKLWSVRPIVSDQSNLPNIAVLNPLQLSTPLGLFAWVNPGVVKAPFILIPDQDNLPNLVLLVTPPEPPPPDVIPSGRWLKDYERAVERLRLPTQSEQIRKAAAVLSSIGGHARAASLTANQRSNIASTAAQARWKK